MTQKFTVEEVRACLAEFSDDVAFPREEIDIEKVRTMLTAYADTLSKPATHPQFANAESLADWLETLHECYDDGAVGNRKWEAAQVAAKAIRATLSKPADIGRVEDAMVDRAMTAWNESSFTGGAGLRGRWRESIDAALAAQGQGEAATLYVEARQCDNCDHLGLNDASETESACHNCYWHGPEPEEDKCPGCGSKNCMYAACPECGNRYSFLADRHFPAPPASPAGVPDCVIVLLNHLETLMDEGKLAEDAIPTEMWNAVSMQWLRRQLSAPESES